MSVALLFSKFLRGCGLLLISLPAVAAPLPKGWPGTFTRAESAIRSGDRHAYAAAREALPGHPLLPWLQTLHLEEQLAHTSPDILAAVLEQEGRAPHADRLRTAWLKRLARQRDHQLFNTHYRPGLDVSLDCLHWRLRLEANAADQEAADAFAKLWAQTAPLPADCRATEAAWVQAGQRSDERVWTRLERVLEDGPTSELKALKALLPKTERSLLDLWQRLAKKPADVVRPDIRKDQRPNAWRPKLAALEALLWNDRDEGLAKLASYQDDASFPPEARARLARTAALALATAAHPQAPAFLAQVPDAARDERLLGVQLVDLLHRRDWPGFEAVWAGLSDRLKQENRWQYWRARADAAQGRADNARSTWTALAQQSSYYGFLARAQLGTPLMTGAPTPAADAPDALASLRQLPAVQRVEAWLTLNRDSQARREWGYAVSQMNSEQQKIAARLALELGWPDRAIVLANRVAADEWALRFPRPNQTLMEKESRQRKVDTAWAFAITRQESLFQPAALSSAGAHGLMQLMPPTAKLLAQRYHIPYKDSRQLLTATTNIRLGVAMLGDLARRNDHNFVYATAAYNAGQSRVDRWHRQFGHLPLDLWVEAIPYRETQQYVKNVMAFSLAYAQQLGQDPVVFQHLAARAREWPAP